MERNNNFPFNPRHYEDHLSVFGRKVLNVLELQWKSDQNRVQNAHQERCDSVMRNRRVLIFRPTSPMICKEMNTDSDFHSKESLDFNVTERNLPHVPTNLQLIQAVDAPTNTTTDNDTNILSHDLITPILNNTIVKDQHNEIYDNDLTSSVPPVKNGKVDDKSNVDWDDMFDTELFSEVAITNTELVLKQIESPAQSMFNVQFPSETPKKDDETIMKKAKYEKLAQNNKMEPKNKNQAITDAMPKKVKNISDKTKISFRKQKYTKAVKNWLNDVDQNKPVEKYEIINMHSERNEPREQPEIFFEKGVEKSNKKVIQTQLANRDGVMKFGKPKKVKDKKLEDDKTDKYPKILDENRKIDSSTENKVGKTFNKEKKNAPRFVAPIKSQIPVKDIEFRVISIDDNNIKDHMETLRCMEVKELVIVLVYRNGFSQLNNHHTEDACDPDGFIISIDDNFFYFKGDHLKNKDFLWSLLKSNKIICYEGKSLLIYFKEKLDFNIHNINIIDAKIGGSLYEPDSPPENFPDLQKLLSITPQYTIATECTLQKTAWYVTLLREVASKLASVLMDEQLWDIFLKIEMKLLPIIAEMEIHGVSVDLQKLKLMEDILLAKMKSRELECHKAAGKAFQINSPVQVRALIYDELKLDAKCNVKIRETLSKGAKSTSESMLRSLVSVHALPKLILEYRHLHKAHATFLIGIAQHVKDGIVRPTWDQTAASTGRIASNNPNLQAIPKAPFSLVLFPEENDSNKQVVNIRSVYTSRAGYTLLAADFNHVECRVFAHAAADTDLQALLQGPHDLFRALAQKWLRKAAAAVTAADRERTKRIVYASLYGAGARKLMDILGVGYDQALSVIASFNKTFPSLKSFGRSVVSRCEQAGGRLATLGGRVRRFKNIASDDFGLRAHAERQAVNFVVQGSAADLCKMAMVLTSEKLRTHSPPVDGHLLLQIHDELVWEIRDQHLETAAVIIKRAMEGCGHESGMAATLPVTISIGKNWGEMTEYPTDLQ